METKILNSEQDAIKQAAEAGYVPKKMMFLDKWVYLKLEPPPDLYFHDPAFWQALGKARGWDDLTARNFDHYELRRNLAHRSDVSRFLDTWKYHALRYFETRLSSGSTEDFWKSLP